MEARREAAAKSLRPITTEELTVLGERLFPDIDHPWQELYDIAIAAPDAVFLTGEVGDQIAFVFSPAKEQGFWFRTKEPLGMGPIQTRGLRILAELVAEQ